MTQEEIIEGNKLIAEFMEWTIEKGMEKHKNPFYNQGGIMGHCMMLSDMPFITSWDWLMPVVDKIQRLKIGDDVVYVKYAYLRSFMYDEDTNEYFVRLNGFQMFKGKSLIEALYISVVDFIKWYKLGIHTVNHTTNNNNK